MKNSLAVFLVVITAAHGAALGSDSHQQKGAEVLSKLVAPVAQSITDPDFSGSPVQYGPLVRGQSWLGRGNMANYLPDTPSGLIDMVDPIYKENQQRARNASVRYRIERRRQALIGILPGEIEGALRPRNGLKSSGKQVLYYPDNARHGACLHPDCPW